MDFYNTDYYTNRELSWVRFNARVLSEAKDKEIELFERLKFLSITASNLDEFFMVRVASLKDMVHAGYNKKDIAGLKAGEQLNLLYPVLHDFVKDQYSCYRMLVRECQKKGLVMVERHEDLKAEDGEYVDRYFTDHVYPVLTPMAVDSSRPFPLIKNKSLNICALLVKKGKDPSKEKHLEFATVQVPSVLPRLVKLEDKDGQQRVIRLEEVIERNMHRLFLNYDVLGCAPFQIMRNADLTIEEEEAEDLLKEIEKQIRKRQWGEAIRLEVEKGIDKRLLKTLKQELAISDEDIYEIDGPLDLTFLMKVYGLEGFDGYRHSSPAPSEVPQIPAGSDVFAAIRAGDILLHHPYQSFRPVVDFIRQAAEDPDVLAIKQTLYRVSGNSPIVRALAEAAENGKQVSVLVELKARFDEENNIGWARMLEKAGCHVIYGLVGLKTHCKIALVVRREEDGIRRYVHLGTGNYNDATARLYTDMGLLTCSESVGEDATAVFNMLSGYSEPLGWNELSLAPLWLKKRLLKLIRRETAAARAGRQSGIRAKMNSLCDPDVIAALYEASAAGVKIDLLVRGICCLKVGIKGVSENIRVYSIVGNYLEHGRIFVFENDCEPEVYLASADWMPRNLERRVEIMFPLREPALKQRVIHILDMQFADNVKKHTLLSGGEYRKEKIGKNENRLSCQELFEEEARRMTEKRKGKKASRRFIPRSHIDE
ncbi:MAG: RNA degradosome polyphosphate kinase [Lachnospiraceae bacterium]|nr:RNA degradosome polyphosphate kinase [Lachnospiraceae bacterium]